MPSIKDLDDYLSYTKGKTELPTDKVNSVESYLKEKKAKEDVLKNMRKAFEKWAKE